MSLEAEVNEVDTVQAPPHLGQQLSLLLGLLTEKNNWVCCHGAGLQWSWVWGCCGAGCGVVVELGVGLPWSWVWGCCGAGCGGAVELGVGLSWNWVWGCHGAGCRVVVELGVDLLWSWV